MKNVVAFLSELKQNNNRIWFEDNRLRYKEIQAEFDVFTQQLIDGISIFDNSIAGVTIKDCTYRIYRDVRFSPNKEPYKTHIGAYICPKGKKSGYAGYYFHIEPNNSILAVGLHCPEPKIVTSVRDEIYDNGDAFQAAIDKAVGFKMDMSNSLKKAPKGFPQENKYIDYLKLKDFDLLKPISLEGDILRNVLNDFKSAVPFNKLLNRAVEFAYDQNAD